MSYIHNEEADFAASELARMFIAESDLCFAGVDEADRPHFNAFASKEPSNTSWPIADGVISLVNANDRDDVAMEYKRDTEGVHGLLTVVDAQLVWILPNPKATTYIHHNSPMH